MPGLDAGFILDGWAGHLPYLLPVLPMLMRRMFWLRLLVIASALAGIAFDHFWRSNPVGVFWQSLLVAVNLGELFLLWRNDRRASFSAEETRFCAALLPGLSPGQARRFLDLGRWETLPAGTVLTREGRRPDFLTCLDRGEVRVEVGGEVGAEAGDQIGDAARARLVRVVGAGHFIGEMSLMGDGRAVATTRSLTPARVRRIERPKLERLRRASPATMAVLETGIAHDMRAKLMFQTAQAGAAPRRG